MLDHDRKLLLLVAEQSDDRTETLIKKLISENDTLATRNLEMFKELERMKRAVNDHMAGLHA